MATSRRTRQSAPVYQDREARQWIAKLERLGMTRREIAAAAHLSPGTVSKVANGNVADMRRQTAQALLSVKPRPTSGFSRL